MDSGWNREFVVVGLVAVGACEVVRVTGENLFGDDLDGSRYRGCPGVGAVVDRWIKDLQDVIDDGLRRSGVIGFDVRRYAVVGRDVWWCEEWPFVCVVTGQDLDVLCVGDVIQKGEAWLCWDEDPIYGRAEGEAAVRRGQDCEKVCDEDSCS